MEQHEDARNANRLRCSRSPSYRERWFVDEELSSSGLACVGESDRGHFCCIGGWANGVSSTPLFRRPDPCPAEMGDRDMVRVISVQVCVCVASRLIDK